MLRYIYISFFVILSSCTVLFGQGKKWCDKIYDNPSTKAQFRENKSDLTSYFVAEILPLISKCADRDKTTAASLTVRFTIDKRGKVAGVTIIKGEMTNVCHDEVTNRLLKMTGWLPGRTNGKAVCSTYDYYISCLNWMTGEN
jgi:hypothetical protein